MTLLPTEKVISIGLDGFTLTTHRVRLQSGADDQLAIQSIMLEQIASMAAEKNEYRALLLLGVVVAAGGTLLLFSSPEGKAIFVIALLVAIALIFLYFMTRSTALVVTSVGSTTIHIRTGHMPADNVVYLIDKIEEAKDQRAQLLAGASPVGQAGRGSVSGCRDSQGQGAGRFYYQVGNSTLGPVTEAELQTLADWGTVTTETFICPEGSQQWRRLDEINEV